MGASCSGGAKVGATSPGDASNSKAAAEAAAAREREEAERLRREAEELERQRLRKDNDEVKQRKDDPDTKQIRVFEPHERVVLQPRVIATRDLPWRLWPLSEEMMKRPPTVAYCDARFKGLDDIEALDWTHLESHGRNNVSLDLSLNRLRDLPLPREETGGILALERVQSLNLSGNYLEDVRAIIACSYLEILDISNNKIVDISPLNACSNLKYLNASNNCLGEGDFAAPSAPPTAAPSTPEQHRSPPATSTSASAPEHHATDNNQMPGDIKPFSDKRPGLRRDDDDDDDDDGHSDGEEEEGATPATENSSALNLTKNDLPPPMQSNGAASVSVAGPSSRGAEVGLGLDARELMASLLVIDISNNPGVGLMSLMHFSALRQLFCSGCGVVTLLSLRGLRNLEELVADRNSISDLIETADVVQALTRLRRLDLTGNPVCSHPMYLALLLEGAADREGDFSLLEELDGRRLEPFEYSVIEEMRAIAPSMRATASVVRSQHSSLSPGGRGAGIAEAKLAPEALAALEAARSRVRDKFGSKSSAFCEALLSTSGENTHLLEIAGSLMDESKRASTLQMDALLHYINSIPLAIVQDDDEDPKAHKGAGSRGAEPGGNNNDNSQKTTNNSGRLSDEDDWPEVPVVVPKPSLYADMRSRV